VTSWVTIQVWRAVCHSAIEDQLDLVWPSKIEVIADHLLEEQAPVDWSVEHLGQGELGLQDGNIVAIAGLSIRSGKKGEGVDATTCAGAH
jgi:hypothetical protein